MDSNINSSELTSWITSVCKSGENFIAEQAPLFIQETLHYHFIFSIIYGSLFAILFLVIASLSYKLWKYSNSFGDIDRTPFQFMLIIISLFLTIGSISFAFTNFEQAIKIKVAPRTFIVEHFLDK